MWHEVYNVCRSKVYDNNSSKNKSVDGIIFL